MRVTVCARCPVRKASSALFQTNPELQRARQEAAVLQARLGDNRRLLEFTRAGRRQQVDPRIYAEAWKEKARIYSEVAAPAVLTTAAAAPLIARSLGFGIQASLSCAVTVPTALYVVTMGILKYGLLPIQADRRIVGALRAESEQLTDAVVQAQKSIEELEAKEIRQAVERYREDSTEARGRIDVQEAQVIVNGIPLKIRKR